MRFASFTGIDMISWTGSRGVMVLPTRLAPVPSDHAELHDLVGVVVVLVVEVAAVEQLDLRARCVLREVDEQLVALCAGVPVLAAPAGAGIRPPSVPTTANSEPSDRCRRSDRAIEALRTRKRQTRRVTSMYGQGWPLTRMTSPHRPENWLSW